MSESLATMAAKDDNRTCTKRLVDKRSGHICDDHDHIQVLHLFHHILAVENLLNRVSVSADTNNHE